MTPSSTSPVGRIAGAALAAAFLGFCPSATLAASHHPVERVITGRSVEHRKLEAFVFGHGPNVVLVLGGIHGNEPSSSRLVGHLAHWMSRNWADGQDHEAVVVPKANPDGLALHRRTNAHGVDLNRNFPSADWGSPHRRRGDSPGPRPASEPETKFILNLISRFHPCRIVSVHAPDHEIDIDGPAMAIAKKMRRFNHDRITRHIGYPTPGSLGTYEGKERHVPVVTLELGRKSTAAIWRSNRRALLAAIDTDCTATGIRRVEAAK